MKKTIQLMILTFLLLTVSQALNAQQSNLIFFSEQGEHFSVILNGILQNGKPETNIKITGLPAPSYKVKILFEDPNLPPINKNLMFQQGTQTTYNIRKNNKGEYVVRFMNQVPIDEMPPPPPDQHVIFYTTVPATSITISQTQNNVTMTTSGPTDFSPTPAGTTSTTTVTTTTTSSEGIEINHQNTYNPHEKHYEMPGYHGEVGCPYPLSDLDFRDVKKTISDKSFEDSKLSIAKQVTSANCLFSSEVKEIMDLFSFEATRLEFAKFAYRYTFDVGNYYKVNEAFQFE
jgi:hypothetical protein